MLRVVFRTNDGLQHVDVDGDSWGAYDNFLTCYDKAVAIASFRSWEYVQEIEGEE